MVDQGRRLGAPGVQHVEQALQDGWLSLARPSRSERQLQERLSRTTSLHEGELEAISIANRRDLLLIVDDKEARSVAGAYGVRYLGAAGMLLQAYREGQLTLEGFEEAIKDLTRVLWLSPTVIVTLLKLAREEQ